MSIYNSLPGTRREIGYGCRLFPLLDLFLGLVGNYRFIAAVARRDLLAKYRGAALGMLWMVGTPAALVLAYGFMTVGVFNSRMDGTGAVGTFMTLWFCVSLWQCFAEAVGRSASIISDNSALVKRTPFPLAALPPSVLATSLMGLSVSYCLGLVVYIAILGVPPLTWLLIPVILTPFLCMTLGAVYLISAIGAFSKDIKYILPLCLTVGMLVSPVLYPASRIPASLGFVAQFNPMTPVFEALRSAVLGRAVAEWTSLAAVSAFALVFAGVSFSFFRRKSVEFADVL
ncbi:ABC transporter permease [Pararhizobium sp. BT-229]|uniref:ABC transporter permease n=1 Tax=Pararhizobium sp. BT-229 TaxID=2986923 RepID=UPI0021F7B6E5|nr:ABC transporter permease [Pararhizobium sp. BT-229]MCV9963902.1 ABC transporter permease [Pararhizobium sp. BT-229]